MALLDFTTSRRNRIIIGSTSGIGLIVATAVSVFSNAVVPAYRVESALDNDRYWEVSDHGAIGVGTGVNAFGASGDCLQSGGGSGSMMSFGSCGGGGGNTGTGALQDFFDNRFVRVSGDTMTGALTITPETGSIGLETAFIVSGAHIRAQDLLTSSGKLVVEGVTTLNDEVVFGSGIIINGITYIFPFGDGSASGKVLKTDGNGNLAWSDDDSGAGALSAGQGLTIASNFVSLNAVHSGTTIEGTILLSGANVHAQNALTSSGTLVVEGDAFIHGTLSGNTIAGFNLTDCNNATTSKLLWDETSQVFSCGTDTDTDTTNPDQNLFETIAVSGQSNVVADSTTDTLTLAEGSNITITTTAGTDTVTIAATDSDTTYNAGQGLTLDGNSFFVLNAVHSGTTITATTLLSGALVHAQNNLTSSGGLVFEGAGSGASFYVADGFSGSGLTDCDTGATSKLLWDATTQRFSCGTDQGGVVDLTTLQDAYDNDIDGSDAIIALTADDDSIIIRDPASGGSDSKFALTIDQLKTGYGSGVLINSEAATGAVLALDNAVKGNDAYGAPHILFGYKGLFDTNLFRSSGSRLYTDDDLWIGELGSGARIHAEDLLTSSGGLAVEGDTVFQTSTDSTTGFQILDSDGGTSVFNVDTTSERVGIGTDSPSFPLHVVGPSSPQIRIEDSTNPMQGFIQAGNTTMNVGTATNHNLIFYSNNINHMSLNPSGQLAIGNNNPEAALVVNEDVTATDFSDPIVHIAGETEALNTPYSIGFHWRHEVVPAAQIGYIVTDVTGDSKGALVFATRDTTTIDDVPSERMRVAADGSVGIGTASPAGLFEVLGTNGSPSAGAIRVINDGKDVVIGQISGTPAKSSDVKIVDRDGNALFQFDASSDITFGDLPAMFIEDVNDSVGIHTITPETELEVVGTASGDVIHAENLMTSSGDLIIDGNVRINPTATSTIDQFVVSKDATAGITVKSYGAAVSPSFNSNRARGTEASPSAVQKGDQLFKFRGLGHNGSSDEQTGMIIDGIATELWDVSSRGTSIRFRPTIQGSTTVSTTLVASGANVGIGTEQPIKLLHVADTFSDTDIFRLEDSDGTCDHNPEAGGVTVTCSSDERLKKNIVDAPSKIDWINNFRIREYKAKKGSGTIVGVIAQEVQETMPERVRTMTGDILGVELPSVWELVKVIQEQQDQIEALEKRVEKLESSPREPISSTGFPISAMVGMILLPFFPKFITKIV